MSVLNKTVGTLIDENYIYARALHYLGIDFYQYEHETLNTICALRGIDRGRLVKSLYQFDSKSRVSFKEIEQYPLQLILEYLRYAHHSYIKQYLPYVAGLIEKLDQGNDAVRDLVEIFPLFVEDFIKHIYEEEDELFKYVQLLINIQGGRIQNPVGAMWKFSDLSLLERQQYHLNEDEMVGLRSLMDEMPDDSLHLQVIKKEIMAFDREILYHSEIENQVFFPKAITAEASVRARLREISLLN
ncbi:MAG: hypothetical protein JXQ90_12350 [Cyclobacteriaceae bacterium]